MCFPLCIKCLAVVSPLNEHQNYILTVHRFNSESKVIIMHCLGKNVVSFHLAPQRLCLSAKVNFLLEIIQHAPESFIVRVSKTIWNVG